jgi:hypothetical protein
MSSALPTWGMAWREAALLGPADQVLLETLGKLPLVPVRCLLPLVPVTSPQALYCHVQGLQRRGLLVALDGPPERSGRPRRLVLVTNLGLGVLAWLVGVHPKTLARQFQLDRAALDSLPQKLPSVLASYDLLHLLAAATGCQPRLRVWRSPWTWAGPGVHCQSSGQGRRVRLPAYAALAWPYPIGQRAGRYVLLADTGGLSPAALRPQLTRLARLSAEDGPAVIVATTSRRRCEAWTTMLDHVAWHYGGSLTACVGTWHDWRSSQIDPPRTRPADDPPRPSTPDFQTHRMRPGACIARPIHAERARACVADACLGTGDRAVLDLVARHPFLPVAGVAEVLGRLPSWINQRVIALRGRGLIGVVEADHRSGRLKQDDQLLEATVRGLVLLAGSLGLPLAEAVRHHGLAGGGPATPIGSRQALRKHLAHTMGADAVFAAIARAARACPGSGLVEWRNAAVCARGRMRPDGYGLLRLRSQEYGFFLEFDRATVRSAALRAKFAAYHRYRSSARAARDYAGFPSILIVTTGPGAEDRIARAIRATDHERAAPLPAFLTTVGWLQGHLLGPLGPVWRTPWAGSRGRWGC